MLKLLGRKTSGNVQKVIWLLEEMGEPYDREDYGRQFNNTETPEYRRLNPNAKVPTMVDGDAVVWESNTILRYLCNKRGSPFYPTAAAKRARVEQWMDWQLSSIYNSYVGVFREAKKAPAERSPAFAKDVAELGQQLLILEGALGPDPYLAGPEITLAEFSLGPIVRRCLDFPVDRPPLPKVNAWRQRLAARPVFAKVATD